MKEKTGTFPFSTSSEFYKAYTAFVKEITKGREEREAKRKMVKDGREKEKGSHG